MLYGVCRYRKILGEIDEGSGLLLEETVSTNATRALIDAAVMGQANYDNPNGYAIGRMWVYRAVSFDTAGVVLHKLGDPR